MFGLRSAQARAILAGTVLVLLLVGMGALAVWRAHDDEELHETLGRTSAAATALEGAQAGFWQAQGALSALVISGDPAFVDIYDKAFAEAEQNLAEARADFQIMGDTATVSAVDDLTRRIGQFNATVRPLFPTLIEADRQMVIELANATMSDMMAETDSLVIDWQAMVKEANQDAATARDAADQAAGVTLWLLLGLSGVALATGIGTVAMFTGSVIGPLAALRASARAIASGRMEARAGVSGPEEVASLARDFNEMTDALAAKTKALQESERRYRLLADNATDIIWTMDMNLRLTYESPSVTRIRGYSPEEAMAQTIEETLTPASLEEARKALAEELALEQGKEKDLSRSRTLELEHTCKDGSTVWLEVTTTFLRDEDGRAVGLLGASRDIGERRRAEDALRGTEERFRQVAEASREWIWEGDAAWRYTYSSPAVKDILGYEPEEVVGRNFLHFVALEERERIGALGKQIVDSKATFVRATISKAHKDGHTVVVESTGLPKLDADGNVVGYRGVDQDITERKRAEEALLQSETKYRTLVEGLPQKVFFKDRGSVYVSCNENYARDLRIDPHEIAGKTDYDFYPAELADKYRADDKRVMQSGETEDIEEEYVQDGRRTFVQTVKTPVKDEDGKVVGVLGIFWDVTERKHADEERRRLHAELELRVITDSLTGLYNHAYFYERLSEEIERSGRYNGGFAVAMMDVDNFKRFNDSRGHQMGDEMLRLIADSIRSGLRRSDLAFRYGGDEFAAILLHADAGRAAAVIDRINRRLAKSLRRMNDGAAARLTLSAGVACFANDGRTADELVRVADAALYGAKWVAQARYAGLDQYDIESLVPLSQGLVPGMPPTTAGSLAAALRELGVPDVMAELNLRTIAALGMLAEIKDPFIRGHQQRTSDWGAILAEQMQLSPDRVRGTRLAALLHDLGKIGVSERILRKPGKLTEEEFAEIKEHSPLGSMMIISEVEALRQLVPIVRHHHERLDGAGYPDGLAGEEIPLEARILAVVDAFDAMTHDRSYRKALSRDEALAELEGGAGTQFDPAVVETFLALVNQQGEKVAAPAEPASEGQEPATVRTTRM
jgi:diguanylate cyclase (GGDEF)-like protein/PAS domain S-box-containing protein